MKISVVTICYNSVSLIEGTLKSVTEQTYPNVEYIVIDGASKDGTTEIIRRYEDRISYWVSEPDKGIYDAMNKGISAATGDYIIFMNAGDVFADRNVLEKIAPLLGQHTVISGKWQRCYSDGSMKLSSPLPIKALSIEMPLCHQSTFTRLSYHKENPFDTSYRFSADYAFFYKAWRKGESFRYIDDIVAFLLMDGASTSNVSASVMERSKAWVGEKNLFLRRLNLRYQILRIKTVLHVKKALKKT